MLLLRAKADGIQYAAGIFLEISMTRESYQCLLKSYRAQHDHQVVSTTFTLPELCEININLNIVSVKGFEFLPWVCPNFAPAIERNGSRRETKHLLKLDMMWDEIFTLCKK